MIPSFRAPLTVLLACALFGGLQAGTAWAEEGDIDLDAMDSAAALQADAIAAAVEQRWEEAKALAIRALEQEASITTAQARLVLARAHEALGELEAADRQVDNYLALPLLERDRSKGEETKQRIARALAKRAAGGEPKERAEVEPRAEREPRTRDPGLRASVPLEVRRQRAGGIGLLAGGAAPTIVGIWFVATDAHWAQSGVQSGTWAAIGAPVLVTGIALEVIGAALIATAPNAGKRVRVSAAVAPTAGGFSVGLQGRF